MTEAFVRALRTDELVAGARVVATGMLGSVHDDVLGGWADHFEPERSLGAFTSDDELVGLARHFPTRLAVPGGSVSAAGVTAVAVLPNHRRQGHLGRLMAAQMQAIVDEGISVGLLVAAEWPIYGRYGYGPAVDACTWELDASHARFSREPTGSIELVLPAELRPHLEAIHDARWERTPGAVLREPAVWDRLAGVERWPGDTSDPGLLRGALWRDDRGEIQGAVSYRVHQSWTRNRPTSTAAVTLLVGTTPEAERELWRHLCSIDWVTLVKAGARAVDDPLPLHLEDGRAAALVDRFDCIWARIFDVPAAFSARQALTPGRAVVEVVDAQGFASGTWDIELGPDGGTVTAGSGRVDVRLPVAALGAAYLGGTSVQRLAEAGWLSEEAPGGIRRLGALLATPSAPWSPTTY